MLIALVRKLRTKLSAQPPMLGRVSDSPRPERLVLSEVESSQQAAKGTISIVRLLSRNRPSLRMAAAKTIRTLKIEKSGLRRQPGGFPLISHPH